MRLFLLFSVAAVLVGQNASNGLLGRWRTTVPTADGIGAMYEFKEGGVVLVRPGAIALGTYKVEGNEIVLPPLKVGGPPNRQSINLNLPGRLILSQGKDVSMDLARVGKSPAKPTVVGEWVGLKEMDGQKMEMRIFFYANGKQMFLLPFQTQQASWAAQRNQMVIQFQDGKNALGPYVLSGDSLSIPSIRTGKQTKLSRY